MSKALRRGFPIAILITALAKLFPRSENTQRDRNKRPRDEQTAHAELPMPIDQIDITISAIRMASGPKSNWIGARQKPRRITVGK